MKFKSLILSATMLLACATGMNAQKDAAYIGAKVGMNIADVNADDSDPRIGLCAGFMGEYFITDKFAVQGEVLYSMQGYKYDGNNAGLSADATAKMDYLNIPILAKLYLKNGLNIYAGPQFGFCVKSKMEVESGSNSATVDMKDQTNTFDFGLALGVGYDFPMGLTTDLRITPSFTNVMKDPETDDDKFKNFVVSLSVGYKF